MQDVMNHETGDKVMTKDSFQHVCPPIVLNAHKKKAVRPVLDFIAGLERCNAEENAAAESLRLAPYFRVFGDYLSRTLADRDDEEAKTLRQLAKPCALRDMFNAMAAYTGNAMLSGMLIVPDDIHKGPAEDVAWRNGFSQNYGYRAYTLEIGFLQLYEGGKKYEAKSSTTIPVILLDHHMLDRVAAARPLAMLESLQKAAATVNHDMLHHYTSTNIRSDTSRKTRLDYDEVRKTPVYRQVDAMRFDYEDWAHASHERSLCHDGGTELLEDLRGAVDAYFDELGRIKEGLTADLAPGALADVVDYFGMVMVHMLARIVPLNHSLMAHGIARLKAIDPDPDGLGARACLLGDVWRNRGGSLAEAMRRVIDCTFGMEDTVDSYSRHGFNVAPGEDEAPSYESIRLIELMVFSQGEVRPHTPGHQANRPETDGINVRIMKAVAETVGYVPSP